MNPFGDGSDGALNVSSGTANLPLNTKHQFTTVNIGAAATLSTSSTTGAVLYICATDSITIDGQIVVSNRVITGNNSWSITIDGVTYTSPGVRNGASGSRYAGTPNPQAFQSNGFGGGGEGQGIIVDGISYWGGAGGQGASSGAGGGSRTTSTRTSNGVTSNRSNATNIRGGGGVSVARLNLTSGTATISATSGAGGSTYGANGETGQQVSFTSPLNGTYNVVAGGGGGGGGEAGRAGITVVLKAPNIILNGLIITSGVDGGDGGDGGRGRSQNGLSNLYALGGGGGGGGNAGDLIVEYNESLTDNGTYVLDGGVGGAGGFGGTDKLSQALSGTNGLDGEATFTQLPPFANFTSNVTSGQRPLTVNFTDTGNGATSWLWNFGDSTTSTSQNPSKTYTNAGTYTVSLQSTNSAGSDTETKTNYITVTVATYSRSAGGTLSLSGGVVSNKTAFRSTGGTLLLSGGVFALRSLNTSAIERKTYMWKVYDEDGNYVGVLDDVITEPTWTEEINTDGSSMEIELARNSDSLVVNTEPLQDSDSLDILDSNNFQILTTTQSRNKVGVGSNIAHNYRVDLFVFYGEVSPILDNNSAPILDNNGETIDGTQGAPNGVRRFTGFISQINIRYGDTETTLVQLTSYGYDLDQYLVKSGSNTTVAFNSFDPSDIVKDGLDAFTTQAGGDSFTTYSDQTVATTGTTVSYTFRANTYSELLQKSLELAPPNWYYYVDLGSNLVYFQEKASTARHQFILGRHINKLDLRSYIGSVVNEVLFTGGGDPALYKLYTRTVQPGTRRSLSRLSDNRVTLEDSADIISNTELDNKEDIQYRSTVTILDRVYDIESIKLGDTVGFRNFDSFVDTIVLQVVGKRYNPDFVELQLDTIPLDINKRIEDITRNLNTQETITVPNAPTT